MRIRYLPPARLELLKAIAYYESQAPRLGQEYLAEVEYALELISTTPALGAPHLEGTRRLLLRRFPFDLVYLVEPDSVVVVALAHHRRTPGYWSDRA